MPADYRVDAVRLLRAAQSGHADVALRAAESRLSRLGTAGRPPPEGVAAASLHYVRGVALHNLGDHAGAFAASRAVREAAEGCGDSAWISIGRSFGVLQTIVRDEPQQDLEAPDPLLHELAWAESDLPAGGHEPFALTTGRTSLGRCYLLLRLYELALPHFLAAADVAAETPDLLFLTRMTSQLNLALLYLEWSMDLRRIGDNDSAASQRASAYRHARLALQQPARADTTVYRAKAQLLAACAAGEWMQPRSAIAELRAAAAALVGHGQPGDPALALMFEARTTFLAGDRVRAAVVAAQAFAALPPNASQTITAAVLHARAEIQAADSAPHSDLLAYSEHLAAAMWRQRLRSVAAARSMQGFVRSVRDQETIRALAFTDALTGIGSRHAYEARVAELTARADGQVALVVIDVDDLKATNDLGGHAAGDQVLQRVADLLTEHVRVEDLVARLGGDEFVILCPGVEAEAASAVGERVVTAVSAAMPGMASVSVGVACGPASDAPAVLRRADAAMYDAKREGGNTMRGGFDILHQALTG